MLGHLAIKHHQLDGRRLDPSPAILGALTTAPSVLTWAHCQCSSCLRRSLNDRGSVPSGRRQTAATASPKGGWGGPQLGDGREEGHLVVVEAKPVGGRLWPVPPSLGEESRWVIAQARR